MTQEPQKKDKANAKRSSGDAEKPIVDTAGAEDLDDNPEDEGRPSSGLGQRLGGLFKKPKGPPAASEDTPGPVGGPAEPAQSARSLAEVRFALARAEDEYFDAEILGKEAYPICLVGCGQAGSEMAGTFRMKPNFVPAYLPEYYPVRAITVDTQPAISRSLENAIGWVEDAVQLHIQSPTEDMFKDILERGAERAKTGPLSPIVRKLGGQLEFVTGGAGGRTLRGRAAALRNFLEEDTREAEGYFNTLENAKVFSRETNAYLLSFSSLGGGTGSGSAPVVVEYMRSKLQPIPAATFSISVVPEPRRSSGRRRNDPRLLANRLAASYYMVTSPAIDGVILSDNLKITEVGYKRFLDIDLYLQDMLMPFFLAHQPSYQFAVQMDPRNVAADLQPSQGKSELIAACFALCPLNDASKKLYRGKKHVLPLRAGQRVPELEDLLTSALAHPSIECEAGTALRAMALVAGPPWALQAMELDTPAMVADFQEKLEEHALDPDFARGFARPFAARFPGMNDVRLTVLLSAPRLPRLEKNLCEALADEGWAPKEGETLATALRRLDEQMVRDKVLKDMEGD